MLIRSECGVMLGARELPALAAAVARRSDDAAAYAEHLRGDAAVVERLALIGEVVPATTGALRDREHFRLLADFLTVRARRTGRPLRIWSAGCSTGEEARSLAATLDQGVEILATDVSDRALRTARRSRRKGVRYRRHNLARFPYAVEGPFAAILCRHVLMYFDASLRRRVIDEFRRLLEPDGILFTGCGEPIETPLEGFTATGPGVHRRNADRSGSCRPARRIEAV